MERLHHRPNGAVNTRPAIGQGNWVKEGSGSFLKKRTKKLLNPKPSLAGKAEAETDKSFLLLFFKKEVLAFALLSSSDRPGESGEIARLR
jgi:hypothetical protein